MAHVLDTLQSRKLTHRAIRLNNVFQGALGQPVTLGTAWAAPPAMHQPAAFESPYTAMCHPAGRGEGLIADDIYALGVLLLSLFAGVVPMANMDDATIIRWKIEFGSHAALTRDLTLSGSISDLLRGMLADDPDHRPTPEQLLDLASLRGRRIAARPTRRSQQALMLNDVAVFDSGMLAVTLLSDHKKAVQFIRNGLVTRWLRRGLADSTLAVEIEDLVRERAADTRGGLRSDAVLVMRTISLINPRMPFCWKGIAFWPDALPALLAHGMATQGDLLAVAEELLIDDIVPMWSPHASRYSRPDAPDTTLYLSFVGTPGALLRLFYVLNPMLPCRLPAMAAYWISQVPDLMRYLERIAGQAEDHLINPHLAAFIAARADRKLEAQASGLTGAKEEKVRRLSELRLLQALQARYHPEPMPALAKWVAGRLRPDLDLWHNRPRREALLAKLDAYAQSGILSRLLDLVSDTTAKALDLAGVYRAQQELQAINAEVAAIDNDDHVRFADAERFGQAIAGGIGLCALILIAISVLL